MSLLDGCDMEELLRESRLGFWKIEFEEKEGVTPRFYADSVTDELMGISADMTPEERFLFHRAHIHQDDMEMFLEYSDKLSEERTEIVYRYIHPISGEMYVRCSGKRDFVEKDRVCIIGFHQDISRTIRMEKEKMAEKRLAEQNYTLRKEHLLQRDYYKDLLDVQNCGLMAYTFPGHRLIHMNAEALRIYGLDIRNRRGKVGGFYIANRKFQLPEVKFLMDAVQSSRFVTQKKSRELLRKLESLVIPEAAKKLREQLFIEPGNKTVNEEIYSNIQTIYDGMSRNRQIRFHYYEWTLSKELKPKKNGEWYQASPWKMIWKNENYYLLGLDERSGVVKHYRVDKMMQVEVIEKQKRNGGNIFRDFDLGKFSSSTFGMFGGKERSVRMEFENQFVGVVLERFGQDVMLIPKDENHFSMQAQIKVSTQFFGWLAGLGTGAVIVSPENIRREYVSFLKKTLKNYGEKYDGKI